MCIDKLKIRQANFFFPSDFRLYFFRKKCFFLIFFCNMYIGFRMVFNGFLKIDKNYFSLLFSCRSNFHTFLKYIFNSYNKFFEIYFFKFTMQGLGYRVFRICKYLYKFYFIHPNYYYLHLPLSVFLKTKGKRLIFYSYDKSVLGSVIAHVFFVYNSVVYFFRGLYFTRQIITLKPGKKRL